MKSAVIGLGFGDEGKGLVTDYLCSKSINPMVVRYSGGQQAGHTVVKDKIRHVFSNFGSGTLSCAPTYWSQFCTIDPVGLINELHVLLNKGANPTLFIDARCPVTTPYDIFHNQNNDVINGTCGVGVGPTREREKEHYSLLMRDLYYPSILDIKLKMISDYYNKQNISLNRFLNCVYELVRNSHIVMVDGYADQEDVIFEGSQGLLLDKNIGFFPHVTRSNVGTKNILTFTNSFQLYLVTRAYQTRHGNGPMTNETIPHNIIFDIDETNINNKYQGVFRRTLLDIDLLLYGINKDDYIRNNMGSATLVITCLDHIKNEYRFTHKGNIIYCYNEMDFVDKIKNIIGINSVLLSRTPYSNKIESF